MANIGLVLSGGMAKGAYQIGVLNALCNFVNQNSILCTSASSIGALNAYAYLTNKMKRAEEMWLSIASKEKSSFFFDFLRKSYIFDLVDTLAEDTDSIRNCFYTTCFNTTKAKLNYINLKEVEPDHIKQYLKASVSLPCFSSGVEILGMNYMDGALIDNIPVKPLMKYALDYSIIVYFDTITYSFENEYLENKLIKINFLDDKLLKSSLSFDKKSIRNRIAIGYEKSNTLFEMIFKNGIDDLEYIYKKIELLNSMTNEKKVRITADIVVNNINKILKKIT